MKKFQLLFTLFLFSSSLLAQDSNLHIYLCFGQSNMEGQGTIESQDLDVDERFKVFQSLDCPNLGRTKENWYTAVPPALCCTLVFYRIKKIMKEIQLRRLVKSDTSQIAKLANNKKVWDNLRNYIPFPYKTEDAEFFIELTEKENPEQTFGIITDSNKLCGVIGLVMQKGIYRLSAEIGFWLGEEPWGKGIATKAIELITTYGFEQLKLERIHAGVFDFNIPSMKALEKNGYQKEGVFRNSIIKNGKICNEHRYAKLRNE